jgi:hypothetical protein
MKGARRSGGQAAGARPWIIDEIDDRAVFID